MNEQVAFYLSIMIMNIGLMIRGLHITPPSWDKFALELDTEQALWGLLLGQPAEGVSRLAVHSPDVHHPQLSFLPQGDTLATG